MSTKVADILRQIQNEEKALLLRHFPQGIVALDLETTGLSPLLDTIVEMAAVKVTDAGVEIFDHLVNPRREIPVSVTKIHGIDNKMVQSAPYLEEILPRFWQFCGDLPLMAHNAPFDIGFLVYESHQRRLSFLDNDVYCSCKFSRQAFPQAENHKLGTLCQLLSITLNNHHRALDDAAAGLRLFAKGLEKVVPNQGCHLFNLGSFKTENLVSILSSSQQKLIAQLMPALQTQESIEILYAGGSHKNVFRPIKPAAILPLPGGNVLYALCQLSNQYKSFALSKIKDVRPLSSRAKSKDSSS